MKTVHSTVSSLRGRYASRVLDLSVRPSDASAFGWIAFHGGLAAGVAWLAARAFSISLPLGCVAYAAAIFFIGTRMRAFGNMLHEASHRTLAATTRMNDLLGQFIAALDFQSFDVYRREHMSHHMQLGSPEKDLDFRTRRVFRFAERVESPVTAHVVAPLALGHLRVFLKIEPFRREDPWRTTLGRAGVYAGLLAGAHWVFGWQALFLYYVVPYVTTYQIMRYWSDAFDHGSIIGEEDEFQRTRNHIFAHGWLNALFLPRNDAYHLTHHLFASVPTRSLPRVHGILMEDAGYAARTHAFSFGFPCDSRSVRRVAMGDARPSSVPASLEAR